MWYIFYTFQFIQNTVPTMYVPELNAFEFKGSYHMEGRLISEEYIQISSPWQRGHWCHQDFCGGHQENLPTRPIRIINVVYFLRISVHSEHSLQRSPYYVHSKLNAFEFKGSYPMKEKLIPEEYIQISSPWQMAHEVTTIFLKEATKKIYLQGQLWCRC